jgi:hypothetical protein
MDDRKVAGSVAAYAKRNAGSGNQGMVNSFSTNNHCGVKARALIVDPLMGQDPTLIAV